MDVRKTELLAWLQSLFGDQDWQIQPASADASFRRYFRIHAGSVMKNRLGLSGISTLVVMDAPPDLEPCDDFINIADQLGSAGLHAPAILEQNLEQGFLLLEDLGQQDYLGELKAGRADQLYADALATLLQMQQLPTGGLAEFDQQMITRELGLFRDWYLQRHLGLNPELADFSLAPLSTLLIDNALLQPQVWVHRDYHSRNLMVCEQNNPGIIDFQDAVRGPITYDLVSLLKDCYIRWPRQQVVDWLAGYFERLQQQVLWSDQLPEFDEFLRWFDLMGVQRHMKAIGIFGRLNYRDHKPGYLADIPRCLEYLAEVVELQPTMAALGELFDWIKQQEAPH
ncbi:MAG: phosphotransferase [Immundisolibacteraceae bacterium]|nr:phosphotransferase [Immundisolibacteraceae bacterium]